MKTPSIHQRIRTTDITVLVQAGILGFLLGELWYLTETIGSIFNKYIQSSSVQGIALIACGITASIFIAYFYVRGGFSIANKIRKSYRLDLIALVVLGLSISVISGGVGTTKYQEYVAKISVEQLMLYCAIPVVIAMMLILRALVLIVIAKIRQAKKYQPTAFFINDQAIETKEDDALGLIDNATRFADRVLNGGSSDSLVFGIDAPWGIGKTSFVNFCCAHWKDSAISQPIVFRFEPLRYTESADLVDKFVNELVNTIQEHAFIPSIRSLFSKYLRQLKGSSAFSFFGIKFNYESGSGTVDETLKALEAHLSELNRKIIIVVDDLDRLSWSEVKNILFAIKRSFILPNVSYVLCYDTENLASLSKKIKDAEKVKEFLEKFVNVKISLFIDSIKLTEFVTHNINHAIGKNLQLEVHLLDQIREALDALVHIYKSDEFIFYQDFIGDIRKLKRLINTMMLFDIQKTDFKNSDYNKFDLINLLLVYINYPNIFRKIYNSETGGKGGYFSLEYVYPAGGGSDKFANSLNYDEYIKVQDNKNIKFLLNKIFHVEFILPKLKFDISDRMSRACFNGQGGSNRNLERYLNLIVKLSKQGKREGYQFYVNKKNDLLQREPIDKIFDGDDFSFSEGDFSRDQLWNIVVNSAHEMKPEIGSNVLIYLMEHLPDYTFFDFERIGAGSRVNLGYSLLKLLDEAAWGVGLSGRRNNNEKNISEIAEWVFGEGRHVSNGVVSTLSKTERGPLGLFDLLLFRLYCSADRGGSLFNLQRAISLHSNPNAQTAGLLTEIAKEGMREISQVVFQVFCKQYIESKINIFEAIDNLLLEDFAGKTAEFVQKQIKTGKIRHAQIEELIAIERSHVKSFIIYQLGNSMISSGVGCGYYDETGNADHKGIAKKVNDYLFDQCFNPSISQHNYEHFLDYLLLNFANTFEPMDEFSYVPSVAEFTKVLDKERLKNYWSLHKNDVLALDLGSTNKRVVTGNYVVTYEQNLLAVYRVLDELIEVPVG